MTTTQRSTDHLRRLAIFVEGKTEQEFIKRLIIEVAGRHNVLIETRVISGGSKVPRSVVTLQSASKQDGEAYYVLIVDCQGDHQVSARILEEHQNLTNLGYEKIIGLRDVYPDFTKADIPKLKMGLRRYVKGKLAPVEFILSVMELEAWFLADFSHLSRIDDILTVEYIKEKTGIDLLGDLTVLTNPATDLHNIYSLVGIDYVKGANLTLGNLDYTYVYSELPLRIASIQELVSSLDEFLTEPFAVDALTSTAPGKP